MQDLAQKKNAALAEILEQLDHPVFATEAHEKVNQIVGAVAGTLQALHSYDRQASVVGHQTRSDIPCINGGLPREPLPASGVPEAQEWLNGALEPITGTIEGDWYFRRLEDHAHRLREPIWAMFMAIATKPNLMLNTSHFPAKLCGSRDASKRADYVIDYGLLLEDVALYQSLPHHGRRGRIDWEDIQTSRPGNRESTARQLDHLPAFPQNSPSS